MPDAQKYTVGWLTALPTELVAAQAFLDEEHERPELARDDHNAYTVGEMSGHHVVIVVLPNGGYGTNSASAVAKDMLRSFPNIRFGLMVGIGGGAPTSTHDVRLGDVVVSSPGSGRGGVLQYGMGKAMENGAFIQTGHLNQPPTILQTAVNALKAVYDKDGHHLLEDVDEALKGIKRKKKYTRPPKTSDRLFQSGYVHTPPSADDCDACDDGFLQPRKERDPEEDDDPAVHYGLIASGNTVVKDARRRDELARRDHVLCFEMEAAGLMNQFPCLVIRGICDYSDSHKNKEWQGFAAMMAAAYAKDLLNRVPPSKVQQESRITHIHEAVQDIQAQADKMNSDKRSDGIYQWLSPPDPSTNYNHARRLRHEDTGQWFLNSQDYKSWKKGSDRFIWLNGKPGCGKTILSSTVIQDMEQAASETQTTLYFYFDFGDTAKQTLESMIRYFVYQLYLQVPGTKPLLDSLYTTCQSGGRQPELGSLRSTLHSMLELAEHVRIVIDALDEASTRGEVLDWIQGACQNPHVCLIATSRPEQDIEASIRLWAATEHIIPLQSDLVHDDIRHYIHAKVLTDPELRRWQNNPKVQVEIQSELEAKAHGVFRWVACQFVELSKCFSLDELRRALRQLPRSLDETYNRMLRQIPQDHQPKAIRILQFLAYSKRPLKVTELVDAVTVRLTEDPAFDAETRLPIPDEVVRYCPGFAITIQGTKKSNMTKTVQLSHYSVKEWLVSDRLEADFTDNFKEPHADAVLAKVCMTYLLHVDYRLPVREVARKYHLADYAAEFWTAHAAASEGVPGTVTLAMRILTDEMVFRLIHRLYSPEGLPRQNDHPELQTPLCFSVWAGLQETARQLLDSGADVHARSGLSGNALGTASRRGNKGIVKLLLDSGADVNAQGGVYGSALEAASGNGHEGIVRLLLDSGADVNAQGGVYGSALEAASSDGHADIVKLLLDSGAKIYGSALADALSSGYEGIEKLLLDSGAGANT